MDLQVLISTMNQQDFSLIQHMNIQSDTIVINQCNHFSYESLKTFEREIKWFNLPERGIGLSRNHALSRACGDVILFADDDVVYVDGYEQMIVNEFREHPMADLIVFNLESTNPTRPEYMISQFQRVRFYNCLRYGTFRIAARLNAIRKKRIFFSQLFGGGSRYGSGEDSLFLFDCIKRGLRVYASPTLIGTVNHKESSWFSGYTEKYFYDKGALFCSISDFFSMPLCLQYCLRHQETTRDLSFQKAYRLMLKGANDFRNEQK